MNLSSVKKFLLSAMLGAITLALAACLNPIGLPSYGSTQGSTGGGEILPGEGRLIIKNLTRDFMVHRVSFTPLSGQDSAPVLEPGPEKSNQRSVTLPSGLWKISLIYGAGFSVSINDVMVSEGSAATVYFYKTNSGNGSLETQWLPPPDADLSGNANPGDVLSEDEGFLHVINKSALSIITGVEYNNGASWIAVAIPAPAGMSGNIAPGQGSTPDLILPRGSWAIRFRILDKDVPSVAVSRTIMARQTVEVDYTDSLLTDRPPAGFGSLRIVNNLPGRPITRIVTRTQVNGYTPEELSLSGPILQGGGSQVRALRAGDTPGGRRDYIVQCYVAADEYYEEVARIIDETITDIFISEDSSKTTEGGGGTAGSLTVYNKYAGQLPFKIFKIYLYRETGSGAWDGYVPPGDPAYPKPPAVLHYNGATTPLPYSGEPFVIKGDSRSLNSIPEGAYKLLIIGGSYNWQFYTANPPHELGGISINEKRITYDCGNVFIAAGGIRTYNFDPYINGGNDRDTPTGVVRINFKHSGNLQGQYGDSGPLSRIQFVAGSELETAPVNRTAHVYNIVPSNLGVNGPQASETSVSAAVAAKYIVYEYTRNFAPMEDREIVLPPGVYGVRVFNPHGNGATANQWYGRDHAYYYDLHIERDAGRTINLQWKWPRLIVQDELVKDTSFRTVTDLKLDGEKFNNSYRLSATVNLENFVMGRSANTTYWNQYVPDEFMWFYADGHGDPIMRNYFYYWHIAFDNSGYYYGFPWLLDHNNNWDLFTHTGISVGSHGPVALVDGYYTLVLTLKPRPGYTFRGISPSSSPPVDPNNVNHQGTGFYYMDSHSTVTNGVGYNNPSAGSTTYRIRASVGFGGYPTTAMDWVATDGAISNTGKFPGSTPDDDRVRVIIRFKKAPASTP